MPKTERLKNIAFQFAQALSSYDILYLILFGSVARGDVKPGSDLDFFIVFDTEGPVEDKSRTKVGQIAQGLEKKYYISIQVIYSNRNYEGIDDYFLQKVFSEGIILYANAINVTLNSKQVRPFTIVSYHINNLAQNEKMKLKTQLYGYKTEKKVGKKRYSSFFPGLLKQLGGRQLGFGTILIPTRHITPIEKLLRKFKARYSITETWLFA